VPVQALTPPNSNIKLYMRNDVCNSNAYQAYGSALAYSSKSTQPRALGGVAEAMPTEWQGQRAASHWRILASGFHKIEGQAQPVASTGV